MSTTPDGTGYVLVNSVSSIEGVDCVTTDDIQGEPQVVDNSSDDKDRPCQGPSFSVAKAVMPGRPSPKPMHFAESHFELVIAHEFAWDPVLLFANHCFYCQHEHIQERAPPRLG
jgi:hypothetical protein